MYGRHALAASLLFALVCSAPTEARASASPPAPEPVPLPGLFVEGAAEATGLTVVVSCESDHVIETSAECEVHARFVLHALEGVRIGATTPDVGTIEIDGRPLVEGERLAIGATARVALSFHRSLSTSTRDTEEPWLVMPVRARHILLGETSSLRRSGDSASGPLVVGSAVRSVAPATVDDTRAGDVDVVSDGAHLSLSLAARPDPTSLIQHGGPLIGLAGRFDLSGEDEGRFLLRVAYELGIADYMLLSLSVETDFDSLMESVVLDVGTPELVFLIPGLVAGVGVVARQLGNRDADAAVRLRAGLQYAAVGFVADFDYWPAIGEWTATMGVGLSI